MTQADPARPELQLRSRRLDSELLSPLVGEHSRPLHRAARGMDFRQEEAEGMVQNVFIAFLSSLDQFEGQSRLRTGLFGILHNKTMERRRKRGQEEQHDPIDDVFESRFDGEGRWSAPPQDRLRLMEPKQLGDAIRHCLDRLPPAQRSVFVLREMEDVGTEDVCKILDVSITNMAVLIHRARNRLWDCLDGRGWGRTE